LRAGYSPHFSLCQFGWCWVAGNARIGIISLGIRGLLWTGNNIKETVAVRRTSRGFLKKKWLPKKEATIVEE